MGSMIGGMMGGAGGAAGSSGSMGTAAQGAAYSAQMGKAAKDAAEAAEATASANGDVLDAYGGVSQGPAIMRDQYIQASQEEERKKKAEQMVQSLGSSNDPTAPARTYFS